VSLRALQDESLRRVMKITLPMISIFGAVALFFAIRGIAAAPVANGLLWVWVVCCAIGQREGTRYPVRLALLLVPMLLVGSAALVEVGPTPPVTVLLASVAIFSRLFATGRVAWASAVVVSVVVTGGLWLVQAGHLPPSAPGAYEPSDPVSWYQGAVMFSIMAMTTVAVTRVSIRHLETSLAKQHAQLRTLEAERAKRQEAEQARQEAQKALFVSQRMEALGQFAARVAHDQNNHLFVVQGWTDLLAERDGPPAAFAEGVEAISEAAANSAQLARQLLAFGQAEVLGAAGAQPQRVVERQGRAITSILPPRISLQLALEDAPPVALTEAAVGQIVLNLVLNARDAMPAGGTLTLRTGATVDGFAFIEVSDTGEGMDAQTRSRIFEPFFTTKGAQGSGLGLASASGLVTQLGGRIDVRSEVGAGSTFTVLLPAAEVAQPSAAAPARPRAADARTVLLVEDDGDVRFALVHALRGAGYTVIEASDAETGLEAARRHRGEIDLLCTDGIMPGAGSAVLVQGFARLYPDAPVLVCSGHLEGDLLRRGIQEGELAFLAKPFTGGELVAQVEALVG